MVWVVIVHVQRMYIDMLIGKLTQEEGVFTIFVGSNEFYARKALSNFKKDFPGYTMISSHVKEIAIDEQIWDASGKSGVMH